MKKTAIEWLLDEIEKQAVGQCEEIPIWIYIFLDQAKEMHKEDCISFADQWEARCNEGNMDSKEQLYDEIYNK